MVRPNILNSHRPAPTMWRGPGCYSDVNGLQFMNTIRILILISSNGKGKLQYLLIFTLTQCDETDFTADECQNSVLRLTVWYIGARGRVVGSDTVGRGFDSR
jgi:hypothetical protein